MFHFVKFSSDLLRKEQQEDLKSIQIHIKRNLSTMATSDNVDFSLSNDEKLIIHNQNSENTYNEDNSINDQDPSLEAASVNSIRNNSINSKDLIDTDTAQKNNSKVNEAITKLETILNDLKKQRDESPEKRVIRDVSKKRSRKSTKNTSSSRRYDSPSETSKSYPARSPSPKRTRKESPSKKYDSDSSTNTQEERYKFRGSSVSSLSSDRSYSCVSKKLKKELSSFLGNSFVSINSKKRLPRKTRRERSYDRSKRDESNDRFKYNRRDSYDRSRYSRKDYSRDRSKSKRNDSYDRYSKRKSARRHSDRYNNYTRNHQQVSSNDIEERYSRYYAVMYAFSIIMDILRQDDIYSTY